jgi:hypothetical protein
MEYKQVYLQRPNMGLSKMLFVTVGQQPPRASYRIGEPKKPALRAGAVCHGGECLAGPAPRLFSEDEQF